MEKTQNSGNRGWLKNSLRRAADWLTGLSFRTGLIVLGACIVCYIVSFAQTALPISLAWKGTLWVIFFGMAKALQYTALLILGKEGIRKIKQMKFIRQLRFRNK